MLLSAVLMRIRHTVSIRLPPNLQMRMLYRTCEKVDRGEHLVFTMASVHAKLPYFNLHLSKEISG